MTQVLGIAHVNVGRLAVRNQQDEFLLLRLLLQEGRRVTQRTAHAGRQPAPHAGQFGLNLVVIRIVEVLEPVVLDIMATVGGKAVDGKRITHPVDRPRQQRGGFTRQLDHRFVGIAELLVGGLG